MPSKMEGLDALFPEEEPRGRHVGMAVVKLEGGEYALVSLDYDEEPVGREVLAHFVGEDEAAVFAAYMAAAVNGDCETRAITPDSGLSHEDAIGEMSE